MAVILLSGWFRPTLFAMMPASFMIPLLRTLEFDILGSLVDRFKLYLFFFTRNFRFPLRCWKHAPWLRKVGIAPRAPRYSLTLIFQEICPYKILWHALFKDVALHRHLKSILVNHHILGFICELQVIIWVLFFTVAVLKNAFISYRVFYTIVRKASLALFSGNVFISRSEHFYFTLFLYVTFFKFMLREVDASCMRG